MRSLLVSWTAAIVLTFVGLALTMSWGAMRSGMFKGLQFTGGSPEAKLTLLDAKFEALITAGGIKSTTTLTSDKLNGSAAVEHFRQQYKHIRQQASKGANLTTALCAKQPALQQPFNLSAAATHQQAVLLAALYCLLQSSPHPLVDCTYDPTLPAMLPSSVETGEGNGTMPTGYFIAACLHNAQAVMPNFIKQLVDLITRAPDPARVFVSIYESASVDETPEWLRLLEVVLAGLGVPHRLVIQGNLTRDAFGGQRIHMLAAVRNLALQPLYEYTTCQHHDNNNNNPSHTCTPATDRLSFLPTSILFANDVMLCAADAVRLLMHRHQHGADMACGLDFDVPGPNCWFYDIWVARDMMGKRFDSRAPFVSQDAGIHERNLMEGWAIPATCCWNGMVALNPEPFIVHGVRFRTQRTEAECFESECSYVCEDMQRLGYHNMMVDPTVRLVYRYEHVGDVQEGGKCMRATERKSWKDQQQQWEAHRQANKAGLQGGARRTAFGAWAVPDTMHCCDGRDKVDWQKCTDAPIFVS